MVVRAKFLLRIFLAFQPRLFVSLHLVCHLSPLTPEEVGSLFKVPNSQPGLQNGMQHFIYFILHNYSTQNPLVASDWLTMLIMRRPFPILLMPLLCHVEDTLNFTLLNMLVKIMNTCKHL